MMCQAKTAASLRIWTFVLRLRLVSLVVLAFCVLVSFSISVSVAQTANLPVYTREQLQAYVESAFKPNSRLQKWTGKIEFGVMGTPMEPFWSQIDAMAAAASGATGLEVVHVKRPAGADATNLYVNVLFVLADNIEPYLRSSFFEEFLREPDEEFEAYVAQGLKDTAGGRWISSAVAKGPVGGPVTPRFKTALTQFPAASRRLPALFEFKFMEIFFEASLRRTDMPTVFRLIDDPIGSPSRISDLDWVLLQAIYDPRIPNDVPAHEVVPQVTDLLIEKLARGERARGGRPWLTK